MNNFKCEICGKRVPHIVLCIDGNSLVCNICNPQLFLKRYCNDNYQNYELRLLQITELQLQSMISHLKATSEVKINETQQINNYWNYKSNNKYYLSEKGLKSMENFLNYFTISEIEEAMDIAFSKIDTSADAIFSYCCGILNNKKKQKKHSPEFMEILKYWYYKRPQEWKKADEGKLEYIITKYDTTTIKYYIDCVVDDEAGWASFESVVEALEENKYR